jgi:hypothetical protein
MTFRRCLLPRFGSFGQAVAEKIFWKSANQKQELPMATMFGSGSGRNEHFFLIDWPSIDASYQVSVHLVKRFQRRFLEIDQPETRIASGGHIC